MAAEGEAMIIDFGTSDSTDFGSATPSPIKANFSDHFWGGECRGFEVLLNNLKANVTASHQVGEYLKERVAIEKTYIKSLRKLSKNLNASSDTGFGGFYPVWLVFLRTLDQECTGKDKLISSLADLSKAMLDYSSKQDDQIKHNMKGDIDSAQKSLGSYRSMLSAVKKSHKSYEQSCRELVQHESELERYRVDPLRESDLKKAEHKVKKLRTGAEHLKTEHCKDVTTSNERLTEFEEKMNKACVKFQALEEDHLKCMRGFLSHVSDSHKSCDMSLYKEYKQLTEKMDSFQVDKLINMFAQIKGTGRIKPRPIKFSPIHIDVLKLSRKGSLGDDVAMATGEEVKHKTAKKKLFRDKKKRKNKAKQEDTASVNQVEATPTDSKEESFEVDEDGYRIRPKDADKIAKFSDDESSHDDSSDFESDSDNEPEKHLKNIKIRMKQDTTSSASASVDELSLAVKTLKLDPVPLLGGSVGGGVKKSGSSQSLNTSAAPQFNRGNISADTRSLHDPLEDSNSMLTGRSSSPSLSFFGPNYNVTSSPSITPSGSPNVSSSLPPWDLSSSSNTPTQQSSKNWTTFSSNFSSGFDTPELNPSPIPSNKPQQNKSIDLGMINESDLFDKKPKDETSRLNKTVPAMPILVPPLGPAHPTGSLLQPPPGRMSSGPRRRGTGGDSPNLSSTRGSFAPSVGDAHSGNRHPSTSSLDKPLGPVSPLMTTQRPRVGSSSTPVIVRPVTPKTGVAIPFAIAFQEYCHAIYKGSDLSKAIVKVTGQLDFSFPSSCLSQLESHEPLKFRLVNVSTVTKILHNENILKKEDEHTYEFIMGKLYGQLKQLNEKKSSPFCNVQGIRYEVICSEATFPFRLTSKWHCDPASTSININYIYNPAVFPSATKPNLSNGTVMVKVDGGVTMHSLDPLGLWQAEKCIAGWKLGPLLPNTEPVTGILSGKFTLSSGPSSPTAAIVQFVCDGSTLSGVSIMLMVPNAYKVSLTKNKCLAGKFTAEPEIV